MLFVYIALNMEDILYKNCQSEAPSFNIPKYMLENLLEEGFKIKEIPVIICLAKRTKCRRMNEYNLSKRSFTNDPNRHLLAQS